MLTGKRVVVTGGTGSLGQVLVRRLLEGELGVPAEVVVFSRSEALQHAMRLAFQHRRVATDDIVYDEERHHRLHFRIGDVRDYAAVVALLQGADVVFHAAAMKQVPTCEYHPVEAVMTNVVGAQNIVRAIAEHQLPVETVVGDLDRQGVQAGQRHGDDEGAPGADPARGEPAVARDALRRRPLRQRARLARLGDPALHRADRARRAGHASPLRR